MRNANLSDTDCSSLIYVYASYIYVYMRSGNVTRTAKRFRGMIECTIRQRYVDSIMKGHLLYLSAARIGTCRETKHDKEQNT